MRFLLLFLLLTTTAIAQKPFQTGAERLHQWLPNLKGKKWALCINHTSAINGKNLVDTLLALGYQPQVIFGPEHGVRGQADAGAVVNHEVDKETGIRIISLYGAHKKPTPEDLKGLDVVIFDMQDVGARFYTYISTMHYIMEACAENNIECYVLDRPNPLGDIVDGPVLLDPDLKSFVGMHPIPVIHGLTIGELAKMINGEGWLANQVHCKLKVIPMARTYTHNTKYTLPIAPSPNLPNQQAVLLYPSLCLFEGTPISIGRGTEVPFQVWGAPEPVLGEFQFMTGTKSGAHNPLYEDQVCYGEDLRLVEPPHQLSLEWLIRAYNKYPHKTKFFRQFFNKLAGNKVLALQIMEGKSETEIRKTWQPELDKYKALRKKYLLYKE